MMAECCELCRNLLKVLDDKRFSCFLETKIANLIVWNVDYRLSWCLLFAKTLSVLYKTLSVLYKNLSALYQRLNILTRQCWIWLDEIKLQQYFLSNNSAMYWSHLRMSFSLIFWMALGLKMTYVDRCAISGHRQKYIQFFYC